MGIKIPASLFPDRVRRHIPAWLKPHYRNFKERFFKPSLHYLEFHLTDHCNLNCKGCAHFSPIADEWFLHPATHERDMQQLGRLFSTIRVIRPMGGEPLLHPQIDSILSSTRAHWPKAIINLVTNGLLIHHMPRSFWDTCRQYSIGLEISAYPPLMRDLPLLLERVEAEAVPVGVNHTPTFDAYYNSRGDSDARKAFERCRSRYFCPFLRAGKLHICYLSAMVFYFNRRFGTGIPSSGFVDIYDPKLTGWDALRRLNEPAQECCYCCYDPPQFKWSTSRRVLEEWDAATYRNDTPTEAHEDE